MEYPKVTLVVPVWNERDQIAACLDRILGQSYPKDRLEILVVDGGSRDGTREVVEGVLRDGGVPNLGPGSEGRVSNPEGPSVRLLDNPKGQRASGLNIGIKAAGGDVIVRVDARSSIPSDYIEQCVKTLHDTGADNVGGVQQPIGDGATQEAIGIVLSHPFGVGNAAFRLGKKSGYVDTVYLGCFRRDVFAKVGLFDEQGAIISEDSDINQRIREAGGKVYLNADIRVSYYPRETFGEFWRIAFRYGGARAGNLLKHRRLTSWRQTVPPAFMLSLATLGGLAGWDSRFLVPLAVLGGIYFAVDVVIAAGLFIRRGKPSLFPRLLLAFPCLHFGWALGFWSRLLIPQRSGTYWRS